MGKIQLLRDKNIFPNKEVLSYNLKGIYPIYNEFVNIIEKDPFSLELSWNYYNDGKAWLGKAIYNKKTIFWLSVWEGYFKLSFFFTLKNEIGIKDLEISKAFKEEYFKQELKGKLRAFIIDVKNIEDLEDVYKLIDYKRSIK